MARADSPSGDRAELRSAAKASRDGREIDFGRSPDGLMRRFEQRGILVDSIRDALGDRKELESKLGGVTSQSVIRCVDPADGS